MRTKNIGVVDKNNQFSPRMNEKEMIHCISLKYTLNWHHRIMRHLMILFANNFQFANPNATIILGLHIKCKIQSLSVNYNWHNRWHDNHRYRFTWFNTTVPIIWTSWKRYYVRKLITHWIIGSKLKMLWKQMWIKADFARCNFDRYSLLWMPLCVEKRLLV